MSPLDESRSSQGRKVSAAIRLLVFGDESTVEEKTERSIVDELGVRVGEEEGRGRGRDVCSTLASDGVVVGGPAVVAVGGDIEESRIGLDELRFGDRLAADGTRDRESGRSKGWGRT